MNIVDEVRSLLAGEYEVSIFKKIKSCTINLKIKQYREKTVDENGMIIMSAIEEYFWDLKHDNEDNSIGPDIQMLTKFYDTGTKIYHIHCCEMGSGEDFNLEVRS